MFDFCFFINLSVILQSSLFPDYLGWYKTNYVLCMGYLMPAIIMQDISLEFHSIDKLFSFILHAFPCIHLHLIRWDVAPSHNIQLDDVLTKSEAFCLPLLLYSAWQAGYLILADGLVRNPADIDTYTRLVLLMQSWSKVKCLGLLKVVARNIR